MTVAACGAAPRGAPAVEKDRIAIVASERGPRGARLVAIDEHGDRQFELVAPATSTVRDANPAISPDGRWLVFASTRERSLDRTSLWLAPLGVEATPARLTIPGPSDAIDSHPVWTRDGRAIVFASTRDGGDFDLWQLAFDDGLAYRYLVTNVVGVQHFAEPVQLTTAPAHEVTPTVTPEGTIIYTAITPTGGLEVESHLEERAADGAIRTLTAGPADSSPACSPDGAAVVFARPQLHGAALDAELWRMARDGSQAAPLVDLPLTDETGPVWSRDGRFVFATSVYRGADGQPLFSSIVHVDLQETPARARMLRDRAGPIVRFTPAIALDALDPAALRGDPAYLPELAKIMAAAVAEAKRGR